MKDDEKKQVAKLFAWVLCGIGVIYIIKLIGLLSVEIFNRTAGWVEWTLALTAEAGIIGSFLSPFLWRARAISTKQHNYWTAVNFGLWVVWIITSAVWVYFS